MQKKSSAAGALPESPHGEGRKQHGTAGRGRAPRRCLPGVSRRGHRGPLPRVASPGTETAASRPVPPLPKAAGSSSSSSSAVCRRGNAFASAASSPCLPHNFPRPPSKKKKNPSVYIIGVLFVLCGGGVRFLHLFHLQIKKAAGREKQSVLNLPSWSHHWGFSSRICWCEYQSYVKTRNE